MLGNQLTITASAQSRLRGNNVQRASGKAHSSNLFQRHDHEERRGGVLLKIVTYFLLLLWVNSSAGY